MSKHLPVVWSEGMLLSPQHLQQWDRYVHHLVRERFRAAHGFDWGFTRLELDREALKNGRLALEAAAGVFPDGTPFSIPGDDPAPAPRSIADQFGAKLESVIVHLALPCARPGRPEIGRASEPGAPMPRYAPESFEVPDYTTGSDERPVTLARRNLVLLFPDDAIADHDALPLAEVVHSPDGGFDIRDGFIPPCLSIAASGTLLKQLVNLKERLLVKSKFLIERRRDRGDGLAEFGSGDPYDFVTLHSVYTSVPILEHYIAHRHSHPEEVYSSLLQLAGALATFRTDVSPKDLPAYDHRTPSGTFARLHALISRMLEGLPTAKAVRIPLEKLDGSRYVGRIEDPRLLEPAARLFLGVRAEVEEQQLISGFPEIAKIGSLDKLEILITRNLRGVPRHHVRVTPSALPTNPNYLYFQLDSSSDVWETVREAKNIAFFVPPQFPGLDLELLGLRE